MEPKLVVLAGMVVDTTTGCFRWTAGLTAEGYGRIGRSGNAHRTSFEAFKGPIPEGLALDHLCHTHDLSCKGGPTCPHRACVNPWHLEPVTQRVNILRGRGPTARQASQTHCIRGHELTPENLIPDSRGGARRGTCRLCKKMRNAARDRRTPATIARQEAAAS